MDRPSPNSWVDGVAAGIELLSALLTVPTELDASEWERLLSRLPPRCRRVFVLRFLHGMTNLQIAERMGVCDARVNQLYQRAARIARADRRIFRAIDG